MKKQITEQLLNENEILTEEDAKEIANAITENEWTEYDADDFIKMIERDYNQ
jgi:hypothetical protein